MEIKERAFSKINISLDIVGKYENGYHEMDMIMQSVSLFDDVKIYVFDGTGNITVRTDKAYIPCDGRNTAYKAAEVFMAECAVHDKDAVIEIKKRIPSCAGLGGGSSDAAAVLRGLNRALGTGLGKNELERISCAVGSDVAFCISGGTVRARGTGTDLTAMADMGEYPVLIVKPQFSISTPALFSRIDGIEIIKRPDTELVAAAIERGDLRAASGAMENVFESAMGDKKREIDRIKNKMKSCGAACAMMTGTGSAVFGIFESEKDMLRAYGAFCGGYGDVFVCRTMGAVEI